MREKRAPAASRPARKLVLETAREDGGCQETKRGRAGGGCVRSIREGRGADSKAEGRTREKRAPAASRPAKEDVLETVEGGGWGKLVS
jgi:hypothetical protein